MKLLIITILLFIPSIVFGATTGVSETRFDINNTQGVVSTHKFWVTNTDTIEQTYNLKLDEFELENFISITPNQFRLEPSGAEQIIIRFRQPLESTKAHISLVATDSNQQSNFKVANGIKIPIQFITTKVAGASAINQIQNISSTPSTTNYLHIVIYTIDGILLALVAFYLRRKKIAYSHSHNYKINFL
jgi:hypothetical protein